MGPPPPEPAAPATLHQGSLIAGRYRLDHPLATGGMARVWSATDEVLNRPVAVKVLLDHLQADGSFVRRFRAEALAAARLTHPSVVAVYDTCSEEGVEAIVMELVDGTTLRARMDAEGMLAVTDACRIAGRVADALSVAHRAHIVHRDIKPANILLATSGRVVVTDFGIAKASEVGDLTTDRQMLGTAKYLAPEQVEGTPVDGRSDLYALGVVLFEMLCGRVPFLADTEAGTALARLHQDPPHPRRLRPDIPVEVEAVVLRLLARRPEDRWPDATSLARALGAAASGRLLPPPPAGTTPPPTAAAQPTAPPPAPDAQPQRGGPTAAASATGAPPSGTGTGATPPGSHAPPPDPAWPGVDPPSEHPVPPTSRRTAPVVLVGVLLALAVLVTGALAWRLIASGGTETVRPAAADFDPFGTGTPGENSAEARLAVDGDPATAWPTESYDDPDLAAGKGGVGLSLDLGEQSEVQALEVTSPTQGWAASAYVFDVLPEGGIDTWGDPVARADGIAGDLRLDLGGASGRYVLLWITRTADDGRVEVAEAAVEVRS